MDRRKFLKDAAVAGAAI
ncbi:MAG: twin-arginine translocation signal domain-containing protein, partial [Bacteroidales bacterium]|nr:twin-arginine translocation signal domain-containing protein [Bacteroidales bacterium]